jgi:hypothetical protein
MIGAGFVSRYLNGIIRGVMALIVRVVTEGELAKNPFEQDKLALEYIREMDEAGAADENRS